MDDDDNNGETDELPITKLEIKNAIQDVKNSKAAGIDNITVEKMKADIDTTVDALHDTFRLICIGRENTGDWCKGLLIKLPKKGDLTNCSNWTGITLMNAAAKAMGKVIIKRLSRKN